MTDSPVSIGENALEARLSFCKAQSLTDFWLVVDGHTFPVPGESVRSAAKYWQMLR
jgi:hypothetical protein